MKLTALTRIAAHTTADVADLQQAMLRLLDVPAHAFVDRKVDVRPLPEKGVEVKGRATKQLAANLRVRVLVSFDPSMGTVLGEVQELVGEKWEVRRVRSIELVASSTQAEAQAAIDMLAEDLTMRGHLLGIALAPEAHSL